MDKLLVSGLLAIILSGCGNGDPLSKETKKITEMIKTVSVELLDLGFAIDLDEIEIKVLKAEDMASMFNNLTDQSQQNFALGPAVFDDGINSRLAFYDPNSKTIVFRQGALDSISKGYVAHELAHVYQDQTWSFDDIWQGYRDDPSKEMFNITQFMVEGYAEVVRQAYEQKNSEKAGVLSANLGRMLENDCLVCEPGAGAGDLPYTMGLRFLAHQYQQGGWPLVDEFMTKLPSSSEQIMHPDKYKRDTPSTVNMPVWPEREHELVLDGSMGEAALLGKLLEFSVPKDVALEAASGWEGDNAQMYRQSDGQEIFIWRIVFDRITDATQLEDALKTYARSHDVLRVGQVVDWILTGNSTLKKQARIFLSKNLMTIKTDEDDENSTNEQEISLKNDANYFYNPYLIPKIIIGPKAQ